MNKLIKISIILFGLLFLAVLADYFALFGTSTKKVLAFSEVTFKPVDKNNQQPIFDAKAVCFRHRNHDACSMRESATPEKTVTVQFPVHKVQTNTWFFQKSEEPILPADPAIKIMVIHNNYASVTNDFDMIEIHNNSGQVVRVEMSPK